MPREIPFSRLLPIALALTLIGLTALWGGWLATGSSGAGQWPFALSAALWPLLAWAGCCSRRRAAHAGPGRKTWRTRHAVRTRSTQSAPPLKQAAPPPAQARNRAILTSASVAASSPEAERKPTSERSPEFAGAFKR